MLMTAPLVMGTSTLEHLESIRDGSSWVVQLCMSAVMVQVVLCTPAPYAAQAQSPGLH